MIKRTTINAYQVGLVFEKGKLTNVLEAGSYWIFGNKEVKIYEMKQSFVAPIEINILLQNQKLASLLDVFKLKITKLLYTLKTECSRKCYPQEDMLFGKDI